MLFQKELFYKILLVRSGEEAVRTSALGHTQSFQSDQSDTIRTSWSIQLIVSNKILLDSSRSGESEVFLNEAGCGMVPTKDFTNDPVNFIIP